MCRYVCVEFGKREKEMRVRVRMRNLRGEVGVEMWAWGWWVEIGCVGGGMGVVVFLHDWVVVRGEVGVRM